MFNSIFIGFRLKYLGILTSLPFQQCLKMFRNIDFLTIPTMLKNEHAWQSSSVIKPKKSNKGNVLFKKLLKYILIGKIF